MWCRQIGRRQEEETTTMISTNTTETTTSTTNPTVGRSAILRLTPWAMVIPVWKFRSAVMRVHDGRQDVEIDTYVTRECNRGRGRASAGERYGGRDPATSVIRAGNRGLRFTYWGFCSRRRAISSKISSTVFLPRTASAMFL
jgi:hypothetical protein